MTSFPRQQYSSIRKNDAWDSVTEEQEECCPAGVKYQVYYTPFDWQPTDRMWKSENEHRAYL